MESNIFKDFDEVANTAAETYEKFLKSDTVKELSAAIHRLSRISHHFEMPNRCFFRISALRRSKSICFLIRLLQRALTF
jgi:hypothetical protein